MAKLEFILVLFSLLTAVLSQVSPEDIQLILKFHEECKSETNVDESLALGTITGHFPDNPELKQHMFCMSKKLGMQNDAGEIQEEGVKINLMKIEKDPEKINQILKKCLVQKADPGETAMQTTKCTYDIIHNNK